MTKIVVPDPGIFELSPLGHAYGLLVNEGWSKRQAMYMAWKSHPPDARSGAGMPAKQIRLFVDVLCLRSDSAVRQWRRKFPDMEGRVLTIQRQGPLAHYRPMVLHKMAEGAILDEYTPDRRLFLEMTGDYLPTSKMDANVATSDGGMTVEEWREQAERRRQEAAKTAALFEDGGDDASSDGGIGGREELN